MITVILEGGLVQAVVSNDPKDIGKIVQVLDYDVSDEADAELVLQEDGSDAYAYVSEHTIEKQKIIM